MRDGNPPPERQIFDARRCSRVKTTRHREGQGRRFVESELRRQKIAERFADRRRISKYRKRADDHDCGKSQAQSERRRNEMRKKRNSTAADRLGLMKSCAAWVCCVVAGRVCCCEGQGSKSVGALTLEGAGGGVWMMADLRWRF